MQTTAGALNPYATSQMALSVTSGAAVSLTVPEKARLAYITVETATVRWRDDGTAPTTTLGQPLAAGSVLVYDGKLAAIKFIAASSTATINVSYYG